MHERRNTMRKGFRSFLSVVLTLSMLLSLTVPAWAAESGPIPGTGAANTPFLVDRTTAIMAYSKGGGIFALRYTNSTGQFSSSYISATGGSAESSNSRTYTGLTATSLVVGTGESVVLSVNLPTSIEDGGSLTYNVPDSSGEPVITGQDGAGVGLPGNTLKVANGTCAKVTGAFGDVTGTVQPAGAVTLGGKGYIVNGVDANDVTLNGSAQVYGVFNTLTIHAGATVNITGDTYAESITIDPQSTLTVQQGVTLCVSGTSVKPTANTRIQTWGTLPAGTYASAEGSWTLGGDVTVDTTACGYTGHSNENTLNATLNGYTLTAKGGTVRALDTGTVVGEGGRATLRVASNGVNARGAFESITMEQYNHDNDPSTATVPYGLTVLAGETISAQYAGGINSVTVKQNTIFKEFNGVLPVSGGSEPYEFLSLSGQWSNAETSTEREVYVGSNAALTVNKDGMVISGTFTKLDTREYSVTLGGDTVVSDGTFTINGSSGGSYNLTIDGGTGTVTGGFRTLTVNGGTVTDKSGSSLTISNTATYETYTGIRVNGGSLKLSNTPEIKINGGAGSPAVYVTGGSLTQLNGTVEAWGNSVHAIEVSSGGEVYLGDKAGINASGEISVPNIICHDTGSTALFINNGGKAWVYSGSYQFNGENSDGIRVNNGGEAYLYPNDSDGAMNPTLDKPLIHVSGTHGTKAAVWVNEGGLIELRGRGALLEQPERNDSASYALYIHSAAKEGCVLAGGTFNGDVFYQTNQTHTIPSIIPVNHYLRFDGTAPNYAASDGSRGILPKGAYADAERYGNYVTKHGEANGFNETYLDRFGKRGEYYSIVDAEWELRQQMTVAGSYQLPAGLLNGSGAVTNTLELDKKDPAKWAIGKMQGDLNVTANSTLYLAGRTLTYDGASAVTQYLTDVVSGTPNTFKDNLHTIAVTGSSLTVIDAVSGGAGTSQAADEKFDGGYIGTGTIAYTGTADDETAAVHVCTGTLQVISGKLSNTNGSGSASGVYLHGGTASFGTSEYSAASENNDNAIIQVNGAKQALKVTSGTANVYGGTLQATVDSEVYGAVLTGGALNVRGGVLSGNHAAQGCGVYAIRGTATITGGGLYGIYKDDKAGSGTSLRVDGATVNLQINADHKDYTEAATDQTAGRHHICNINVKSGTLNVGTRGTTDNYLRNNGALLLEGGTTCYFGGVTMGNTEVYGANTTDDFGTKLFVESGHFGDLFVYNDGKSSMTYTVNLNKYVQLHGGYFKSITNNAAASAPASSVQSLIGVWSSKNHDGTGGLDWARYNHYAAMVSTQRNQRGEWSAVTAIQSGTAKTDAVEQLEEETGKAISIRNAADEFKTWAAGGTPNTFKLYANLWMGDSALCNASYCDATHEPVTVNAAARTLDLNGFGIFGESSNALLNVGSGGNLTVVKGDDSANDAYADRVRNFGSGAALNTAANGTLTVDGTTLNSNSGAAITTAGKTTVKSGIIMGVTYGVNATDGNLTVTGGTIGGAGGIDFNGNGNLSISGGAIKRLHVGTGSGTISLTGDATYEAVNTDRDSVYSSLLGNKYDWQKSVSGGDPVPMPRSTTNYGTSSSLIRTLPAAVGTVYSVKPATHRLTLSETGANMTTNAATKALTVKCYVDDAELENASVSAATGNESVATVTGTYPNYTVTKVGTDSQSATITFTSAYGDTATFRVNPTSTLPTGGGGGGAAPAPATTVSVSGDENSVSVSAKVNSSTATMSEPTEKELEKVIGTGVETGEVVINMSGLNSAVTTAAIPASTVKAVEKAVSDTANDADELSIKLPNATATFDAAAVSAIASQTKGTELVLSMEKIEVGKLTSSQRSALNDIDVQEVISVTLKSGTTVISDFKGGSATVSVHYALKSGQSSRGVVVWYIANDGSCTESPATYANGRVTFITTHFSDYVIAYDAARAASCPQDSTCPIAAFTDADAAAWYHDGVHWALENGVMNGYDNPGGAGKVFAANGDTTRAMVARILWNLEGKPAYVGASEYNDVDNEAWYGPAIRWASAEGIATGYKNPTGAGMVFDPEGAVTREQLAAMLYRYALYKKADVSVSASLSGYGDVQAVSGWAESAMQWAVGAGIINGIAGSLVPAGRATRAQVATMLMRYSTAK